MELGDYLPTLRTVNRHPDDELLGWLDARHAGLAAALGGAHPSAPIWTRAPRRDVAYLRRQLHGAVVHTVDVEQVLADVRPVPTALWLDGLDEWPEVIVPATWPVGSPIARPVTFHVVDAGIERTLFPGTRPFPIAALIGTAGDLLLTAWRWVRLEVLTVGGTGCRPKS